jgi:hypothetical protein
MTMVVVVVLVMIMMPMHVFIALNASIQNTVANADVKVRSSGVVKHRKCTLLLDLTSGSGSAAE